MTEAEWLASKNPVAMLDWPKARRFRARKLRLFAVACGRRMWQWLPDERSKAAIVALETFADGPGKQPDKERLREAWEPAYKLAKADKSDSPKSIAASAVAGLSEPTEAHHATFYGTRRTLDAAKAGNRAGEAAVLAELLRDIIGNPFAKNAFDLSLRTTEIRSLGQACYDERDAESGELERDRLLVLSDALEEAGCTNAALLEHLRGTGAHVRGCWALDLVLGKE